MHLRSTLELTIRLLELTGIQVAVICIYLLSVLIRIKTTGIVGFVLLEEKQKVINLLLSLYIWGLFPIWFGAIIWVLLLTVLRFFIFKTDSIRFQMLYETFEFRDKPYPIVRTWHQLKETLFSSPTGKTQPSKYKYSIGEHFIGFGALLILFALGKASVSQESIGLFWIDSIILATAIFVFVGKLVLQVTYNNVASVHYLSPISSYTLIALVGVIYYIIAVSILMQASRLYHIG